MLKKNTSPTNWTCVFESCNGFVLKKLLVIPVFRRMLFGGLQNKITSNPPAVSSNHGRQRVFPGVTFLLQPTQRVVNSGINSGVWIQKIMHWWKIRNEVWIPLLHTVDASEIHQAPVSWALVVFFPLFTTFGRRFLPGFLKHQHYGWSTYPLPKVTSPQIRPYDQGFLTISFP